MRKGTRIGAGLLLLLLPLVAAGQGPGSPTRVSQRVGVEGRSRREPHDFGNPDYDGRFVFTRIRYSSGWGWGGGSWAHDYPRADLHLPRILEDLTTITPRLEASNVLDLDDPEIFSNPILYISEPGFWTVGQSEAENLRTYLLKGGFLIFDDFEHAPQWNNMAAQMARVLPQHRFIQIDVRHPIFHSFFEMKSIDFPHPLVNVMPSYFAIFENNDPGGRMLVLANYNSDLAEYWEWSATGMFPVDFTSEAYKLGVNYIVYAMTH
jgi:hypothetical protein